MILIEELAHGIVQITNRGDWDAETWEQVQDTLTSHIRAAQEPIYVLLNLSATTTLDPVAFGRMVTSPICSQTGMTILVARRAHLKLAREILSTYPQRDEVCLRLMTRLDDAIRIMLDRQALGKLGGTTTYGA